MGSKSPISSAGVINIAVGVVATIAAVRLLCLFVGAAICLVFIRVRFLGRKLATDLGVSVLLAVGAFDFRPCNASISPVPSRTVM